MLLVRCGWAFLVQVAIHGHHRLFLGEYLLVDLREQPSRTLVSNILSHTTHIEDVLVVPEQAQLLLTDFDGAAAKLGDQHLVAD